MSYFLYVPTVRPASKVIPSRPTNTPPPKTQTQTNPKLSLATIRRQICCLAPVFFQLPTHHMIHHNTTGAKTPILEWEGGGDKEKPQSQMKYELPQKDLSLSLSHTSSPREETAMQPRLEALNSNSFQTIFCKTVNQYKETILCKWRSRSSRIQWFSQRDAKALCI